MVGNSTEREKTMTRKRHRSITRAEQSLIKLSTILSVLILLTLFVSVARVTAFPAQQKQQRFQTANATEENENAATFAPNVIEYQETQQQTSTVYLPAVMKPKPVSMFGVETSSGMLASNSVLVRATELNPTWVRLKSVNWRFVQPQQGGAYDWSALATFEKELVAAAQAQLTPIAIVHQNPDWATIPYQDASGQTVHAACGAVATE